MIKEYKLNKILLVFLIVGLILSSEAVAGKIEPPPHIKLLHDRYDVTVLKNTKRFNEFLREDEAYLKNIDLETLEGEIALFDQYMYNSMTSFKKTKRGVLLYAPNSVGNIVVCEAASKNRRNLLKARQENKKFKYDRGVFHYPRKSVRVNLANTIEPKKLKVAYEEIINVLDNVEFPDGVLEDTIISLSPFKIRGVNAFAETYGPDREGTTLVLGIDARYVDEDTKSFRESVRSTLLHELGHAFHQQQTRNHDTDYELDEDFWKEYRSYYEADLNFDYKDKKTRENWGRDIRENMAEDFRIHYSSRMGDYSFKSGPKRTDAPYNPEIGEFFYKYSKTGKKSDLVCLRHSTAEDPSIVKTMYYYSVDDIKNKDGLEIRVQSEKDQVCEGSYIGIWEEGNDRRARRIPVKDDGDTLIDIPKNSNINIVIKYVKINNKYRPLWRLNIN